MKKDRACQRMMIKEVLHRGFSPVMKKEIEINRL